MRRFFKEYFNVSFGDKNPKGTQPIDEFKSCVKDIFSVIKIKESLDTELPQLINKMVKMLLEEDRNTSVSETAPCIEYFLNQRIVERLIAVALTNSPVGIFPLIVYSISRIVQHMKSSWLGHSSVHKYIVHLLESKETMPDEDTYEVQFEVMKLIHSLTIKLKEVPMLTKLFWTVETNHRGEDGLVKNQSIKHFILFNKLDRMYRGNFDPRLRDLLRRCILSAIIIDDSCEDMQIYLSKQTKFIIHTVKDLRSIYSTLTEQKENTRFDSEWLEEYTKHTHFCNELCKIIYTTQTKLQQKERFYNRLTDLIIKDHVEGDLIPGLLSNDASAANIHTIIVREMLLQIDSHSLGKQIIEKLLPKCKDVLHLRIERVDYDDSNLETEVLIELSVNTLRLISTLCSFHVHTDTVVKQLLFESDDVIFEPQDCNLGESIDSFFDLIMPQEREGMNLDLDILLYSNHIRQEMKKNRNLIADWVGQDTEKQIAYKPTQLLVSLLRNLESFFQNSMDFNIFATQILSYIAQYPILSIHYWCLNRVSTFSNYSIHATLTNISKRMHTILETQGEGFVQEMYGIRCGLERNRPLCSNMKPEDALKRLVSSVLLFNEVVKELVASFVVTNEGLFQ